MARILVVDDEPDIRALLELVLIREGHDVETATDGLDALERYIHGSFDLICVDLDMPRLSGIELTRAVRAHRPDDVPILMVTGSVTPQDIDRARMAGVSDVLGKPFTPSQVREQAHALLERSV